MAVLGFIGLYYDQVWLLTQLDLMPQPPGA
jgi:hypothetical protein